MRSIRWTVVFLGLVAGRAAGDLISVPADHTSIQTAILAAVDGDEIVVAPGTYYEIIDFLGKTVTLRSSEGPEATEIYGGGWGTVVSVVGGEGPDTVIEGFRISHGHAMVDGGGFRVEFSAITIRDCILASNYAEACGGSIAAETAQIALIDTDISSGSAFCSGTGGMVIRRSTLTAEGCGFRADTEVGDESLAQYVDCSFDNSLKVSSTATVEAVDCAFNAGAPGIDARGACQFERCTFQGTGTAMEVRGPVTANECTFIDAGGVAVEFHGVFDATDCTFRDNQRASGGAIDFGTSGNGTIRNCRFESNSATSDGGAIHTSSSDLMIALLDCTFRDNHAGDSGGAVLMGGSNQRIVRCEFLGNTADREGGGLFVRGGTFPVVSARFVRNEALRGGAVFAWGFPIFVNVQMVSNSALERGGGVSYMFNGTVFTNCTMAYNTAPQAAAIDVNVDLSQPATVNNSIIQFNETTGGGPPIDGGAPPSISYSNVQGGWAGEGNLDAEPLFVDVNGCDGVAGTLDDDYRLGAGSPSIDSGDDARVVGDFLDLDGDGDTDEPIPFDVRGADRFLDGDGDGTATVDMGAYENVTEIACCADIDGDGLVGIADLLAVLADWGPCGGCAADIDGDGVVGVPDLLAVLAAWGACG